VTYPPGTAAHAGLAHCHVCLKLSPANTARCPRCRAKLHLRIPDSLQQTVALLATSIVLLIPANLLPITTTDQLGSSIDSTIIGGVLLLWQLGSYPIAAVIFIASVIVPISKILGLVYLCWSVNRNQITSKRERTVLYRCTEFIGRWSMIDIFVVAILVALIQLGGVLAFRPGIAALAFASLVIVTMIAAERFDPRLIWDRLEASDE